MNFKNLFFFVFVSLVNAIILQSFGLEFGPDYYGGIIVGCLLMIFLDFFPIWK